MSWHDMATHMQPISLAHSNVHDRVHSLPLTPLHLLDTVTGQMVQCTRQNTRAQTCTRALERAPPCTRAPRRLARSRHPAPSLCATSSATSSATARTSPLARGNTVDDELVDDFRHGL
jgi:hypothetical protein